MSNNNYNPFRMITTGLCLICILFGFVVGNTIGSLQQVDVPVKRPDVEEVVKPGVPDTPSIDMVPSVPETEPVLPETPPQGELGPGHVVIPDTVPETETEIVGPDHVFDELKPIAVKYTTASLLNVRSAPGTEFDIVKQLPRGSKVFVLKDRGDWCLIRFSDDFDDRGYVASKYLNDTVPAVPSVPDVPSSSVKDEMSKRGSMGRLYIPSLNVNVALFASWTQDTVDAHDSAAYLFDDGVYGMDLAADHVNQAFGPIKRAVPGSTLLKIDDGDSVKTYICNKICRGWNIDTEDRKDLAFEDGSTIRGSNNGGLCLYTCNSDGSITLTFWQPV